MEEKDEKINNKNKNKNKLNRTDIIILIIVFLVPIGFGIFSLIPEPTPPSPPPTPVVTYEVKLINNDDNELTLTNTTAYSDKKFSSDITLNRSIAPTKALPDSLSPSDVLCLGQQINFTYEVSDDKYSAHIDIPSREVEGNITINVPLEEGCHHEYSSYLVVDNKLYGICKKCGEQILISDYELEGETYKNKILVVDQIENNAKTFTMEDISYMTNFVSTAAMGDTLEMYLITGEYDLEGFRAWDNPISIKAHGLFKNDGETLSATVDCSPTDQSSTYPREYGDINFVFDNLIMLGVKSYDVDFHFGLFASTITYNKCEFYGKQSCYSLEKVEFNDCYFDSTGYTSTNTDYSIYTYFTPFIDFNRCNFVSDGKALKIYTDGKDSDNQYNITNCNFVIKDKRSDKAAIQIDSTNATETNPLHINITNCTQVGYAKGLWNDQATAPHLDIDVK